MHINLGCGRDIREGWINVDVVKMDGIDIVCNLNSFPYPFEENSADYILMNSVLEHLDDTVSVMKEVHRILKPSGRIEIMVPYYKHKSAFTDPTHKRFFTEKSMDFFIENNNRYADWYSDKKYKLIEFKKISEFPFWRFNKRFGTKIKTKIFPSNLKWILEVIK